MLDMSWGELMLIGGVALIVIGPKELPKALRTLGQVTGKLRRMAGEFRMQFDEAIREAELDDIKNDLDGVKRKADAFRTGFNPVDTIRNELKSAVEGRDTARSPDPTFTPLESTATSALNAGEGADSTPTGSYDVKRPTQPDLAQPDDSTVMRPNTADGRAP